MLIATYVEIKDNVEPFSKLLMDKTIDFIERPFICFDKHSMFEAIDRELNNLFEKNENVNLSENKDQTIIRYEADNGHKVIFSIIEI